MLYSFSSSVISYGVLSCVFTFWVPFCDVRYDFRIQTMFGYLSLAFLYYSLLITTVLEWMNDLKSVLWSFVPWPIVSFLTTVKHFSQKWNGETHWMEFALAPPWADLNHPFQWNLQELARVFDWQHICYVWWTSTFIWVPTVLLFSWMCSSYEADVMQGFLKKNGKKVAGNLIYTEQIMFFQ